MNRNNENVIKIFEDRTCQLNLSDEQTRDILKLRPIIGDNNVILQADGRLLIRHYVGFFQINNTRLLIYPKISQQIDEEEFNNSFNIMMKMLFYAGYLNVKELPNPNTYNKFNGDLLEIYISIFIKNLLELFKRDINKSYIRYSDNKSFIKGKIDFRENIKQNSYKHHLHYIIYDEFSTNTLMNRLFKSIIQHLILKTKIQENKLNLKQVLVWLEDVEPVKITNDIWDKVVFTRLNEVYRPIFNMAKLFYFNSQPNLNKGDELAFSFLIPVNQLFERYVYKLLEYNNANYKITYQKPQRYLGKLNNVYSYPIRPDISILDNNDVHQYIIDAKYKELFDKDYNLKTNIGDLYQMLAYSVIYQCNQIALVYPKFLHYPESDIMPSSFVINKEGDVLTIKLLIVDIEMDFDLMSKKLYFDLELNN